MEALNLLGLGSALQYQAVKDDVSSLARIHDIRVSCLLVSPDELCRVSGEGAPSPERTIISCSQTRILCDQIYVR